MAGMSTSSRMAVGVAAAAVGVGVSQLLSRFVSPTADVMNLMPEPIREWTIQEFGTSARLFVSIMVLEVVAAVAAVIAIWRRSRILQASFLVVGVAVCAAVLSRPEARLAEIVPPLAGVACALGVLRLLTFGLGTDQPVQADVVDRGRRHSLMTLGFATAGIAGGVVGAASNRSSADLAEPARGVSSPRGTADANTVARAEITAQDALAMTDAAGSGKTVFVEEFRDGARTDNEIIAAAFDALKAGGEIRFGQGVTYVTTSSIVVFLTDKPHVLINGQGATLHSSTAKTILSLRGSKQPATTSMTAAVTSRTNSLSVASTSGCQAGDVVAIRSNGEPFASPRQYLPYKQEIGRVASVPDDSTIVLEARTWNTYSLAGYTVEVQLYKPIKNLTIRDLNIVGAGDGTTSQTGLNPRYFDGLTLYNVTVSNTALTGIDPWEGINFTATSCRAEGSNLARQGYGFHSHGCHSVKWIGCYGRRNRHSFDAHETRELIIHGCTAENDDASGLSTHSTTDVVKIVDCTARECGGGIITRGPNTIIRGNHIFGTRLNEESDNQSYRSGIIIGDGATNLLIDGNYIDISGPAFAEGGAGDTRQLAHGISLIAPMVNAQISNNRIKGFPTHGVYCNAGTNTGVGIVGNYIDCSAQVSGTAKIGIALQPADADEVGVQTDITIDRNVLPGGAADSGIYVAGGPTRDLVSDHIRIRDNRIGAGCATTPIHLDSGYFGSDITVAGNETADVQAAQITVSHFVAPPYVGNHGYGRPARPLGIGQEAGARMRPGLYYGTTGSAIASLPATLDRLSAVPLFVPQRVVVDRIGVTLAAGSGTAGSEARLAIYEDVSDSYGGYPGDLVPGSAGIVATDSAGYKENTDISVTLNPGLYWLAFVAQTAAPDTTVVNGNNPMVGNTSTTIANKCGYVQNGVNGELPSTFSTQLSAQSGLPLVQIRIAPE